MYRGPKSYKGGSIFPMRWVLRTCCTSSERCKLEMILPTPQVLIPRKGIELGVRDDGGLLAAADSTLISRNAGMGH